MFRQPETKNSVIARQRLAVGDLSPTDMLLRANKVAWQSRQQNRSNPVNCGAIYQRHRRCNGIALCKFGYRIFIRNSAL